MNFHMVFFDKFNEYFVKSWKVVLGKQEVIDEIARDEKVMPYAILINILPAIFVYGLQILATRIFDWQDFVIQFTVWFLSLMLVPLLAVIGRNLGKYKNPFALSVSYLNYMRPAFLCGVVAWVVLIPHALLLLGAPMTTLIIYLALAAEILVLVLYFKLLKAIFRVKAFHAFVILMVSLILLTGLSTYVLNFLPKLGINSETLTRLLAQPK